MSKIGIGYTLGTGRLFCEIGEFKAFASELLERPVLTHELASDEFWTSLRSAFEQSVRDEVLA